MWRAMMMTSHLWLVLLWKGLPEADAEMSDGAAPAVGSEERPTDARSCCSSCVGRTWARTRGAQAQVWCPSPEHAATSAAEVGPEQPSGRWKTQHTTPGGSSSAGDTPAGSISSTEAPPPTDTRTWFFAIFQSISVEATGLVSYMGMVSIFGFEKCSGCCNVSGGWSGGPRILDCTFKVLTPAAPN